MWLNFAEHMAGQCQVFTLGAEQWQLATKYIWLVALSNLLWHLRLGVCFYWIQFKVLLCQMYLTCAIHPSCRFRKQFACCDGRVVKALDLKSNGIFPRRFEPCSQRISFTMWVSHQCQHNWPPSQLNLASISHLYSLSVSYLGASKLDPCFRPGSNRGPFAC